MGPIRYMARNSVAANIFMMMLIVGGGLTLLTITVEVFPETTMDVVTVSVAYPGAGPEEVEEGICQPIEEAVHAIEGVKRVLSFAREGGGSVSINVIDGHDVDTVVQDVKSAVDRITTFPKLIERPVIKKVIRSRSVITVVVHGEMDMHTLRQQGEALRDGILALPGVTQADLGGLPPYEIAIEIKEATLRSHGLTLGRVAAAIRAASLDLPAGAVKDRGGEILLRTKERRYTARQYEDVVVLSKRSGALVKLADIASVKETFRETDQRAFFDGRPAALVEVYRVGDETPLGISEVVKAHLEQRQASLPAGIKLSVWSDRSEILQARLNLLLRNAALGLVLVIVILGAFLQVRLAFWVTLGIPLSMLGAMIFVPQMDVTINMISLFAFIVVLGIVVDDAIVVGENAFYHRGLGKSPLQASVDGAREVSRPVTFSILTTIAAVAPLLFVSGLMGKFMRNMPVIIIAVLLISLLESLFILPAHLAHSAPPDESKKPGPLRRLHALFGRLMTWVIQGPYTRVLSVALRNRYATLALGVTMVMLVGGLFAGKHIKFIFMPTIEGDLVRGKLAMPFGTPVEQTRVHLDRMLKVAQKVVDEYDAKEPNRTVLRNIFMLQGGQLRRRSSGASGSHLGEVAVYLVDSGKRNVNSQQFARRWRKLIGEIPGAESLEFDARLMHMGNAIDVQLAHQDFKVLEEAADRVKEALEEYPGVFDIMDSHEAGKRELELKLRPGARALGITPQELANQVRGAFYGAEALRLQRGRNEVKVMVRYPLSERRSLTNVDSMRIRTATGGEVAFAQAATVKEGRGYTQINRAQRKRVIDVMARVNFKIANAEEILEELKTKLLPQLMADYQGLTYDLEGQRRERRESMESMRYGFLVALAVIFALLAIPFRSYSQPLIIMSAIPFGIIGAVMGHLIMGYNLSLISMMGVVALTGVVVNDSLVLVDFVNRYRRAGNTLLAAIMEGGKRRFRPIVLTTLTTFFALLPMLAETSVQARFLVPMAISLGFGVLFATFITLILIPVLYLIMEDIKTFVLGRPSTMEEFEEE